MSHTIKTLVFAGVALVALGIGVGTHRAYKPADLEQFSDVGEEFFPDFTDPNVATGLRVASFNDETGKTELFSVEFKDGLWRIPSHHDYPADGEDQLAKTAASMIGVKRSALVENSKAAHKRYKLLDPLDDDVSGTEGRGDRITLTEGEKVLADFIVGEQVEGQENTYYVRAAGEDRFYTADLGEFDISTKFSDWIAKDILDINRNDVNELVIDRYQIDEARGVVVQGDQMELHRDNSQDDWKLNGIDEATEKVNTSNINTLLLALDDLAIVGVRTKPPGISADLKAEGGVSITTFDMLDLQDKGFFITQGRILSNEGEVLVGTNQGVLYALRFGEEFSGTDVDIEVGTKKSKEEASKEKDAETEDTAGEETTEAPEETEEVDSLQKSRYLFVTAQFDEGLLGKKPTPPVKPEPPAESADSADANDKQDAEENQNSEENEDQQDEDDAGDEQSNADEPDPQAEYEKALAQYNEDMEIYELAIKEYQQKIESGNKRVAELNRRFADWYYVIAEDVFDRMKLNRTDIVEPQEAPENEETTNADLINHPLGTAPETSPANDSADQNSDPASEESQPVITPESPDEPELPQQDTSPEQDAASKEDTTPQQEDVKAESADQPVEKESEQADPAPETTATPE